jgi:hypothetical protein
MLFPGFRSYLTARDNVNNELDAPVVGAGVAAEALGYEAQDALLPIVCPDVAHIQRMNQPIGNVRTL